MGVFSYIVKIVSMVALTYALIRNRDVIKEAFYNIAVRLRMQTQRNVSLNDSFMEDVESGLSSRNFDLLLSNSKDTRNGLDDASKGEIRRIMKENAIGFDAARKIYVEEKFVANGIAPNGIPLDPKAFTFVR